MHPVELGPIQAIVLYVLYAIYDSVLR